MKYEFNQFSQIKGPRLTLEKIKIENLAGIATALISNDTWFSKTRNLNTVEEFTTYFTTHIKKQDDGEMLLLVAKYENKIVAMSVFQFPSDNFTRVEIGFTWISDQWKKTFVNTELKYLMLSYAFNEIKTYHVEFVVHPLNSASNNSMLRIGATLEGTLRKWRFLPGLTPDDGNRHIYSIIDSEWPEIKNKLEEKFNNY